MVGLGGENCETKTLCIYRNDLFWVHITDDDLTNEFIRALDEDAYIEAQKAGNTFIAQEAV